MFKLKWPSKYSPLFEIDPSRRFLYCSAVFQLIDFDALLYFCHFFCFTIVSTSAKYFEDSSHGRETTKSHLGRDGVTGRWGTRGHAFFKNYWTSAQCGQLRCHAACLCKSPIMKWTNVLSLKNNTEAKPASCHIIRRHDAVGFLEHSPSGGSLWLQRVCSPEHNFFFFFGKGGGLPLAYTVF